MPDQSPSPPDPARDYLRHLAEWLDRLAIDTLRVHAIAPVVREAMRSEAASIRAFLDAGGNGDG